MVVRKKNSMKTKFKSLLTALTVALLSTINHQLSTCSAQGTAFTYQGRLNFNGNPAAGNFDVRFAVFDANTNGNQLGVTLTNSATAVTNGLFAVTLDFGAGIFTGPSRWLEIAARTNGGGAFTTLTPRQWMTPVPYAIFANTASTVSGTISSAQLGGGFVGNAFQFTNSRNVFVGDGSGLSGVNANSLNGLQAGNFWQTTGNAGTDPVNGNFLGTTDNQPLELRVNSNRALRIEPNTNGAPNLIGGSSLNYMAPGVIGSTIGGGGAVNDSGFSFTNSIAANYSVIGGGFLNAIQISGYAVTIGGGDRNMIQTNDTYSVIAGGGQNTIKSSSQESAIGGGLNNVIGMLSGSSTIAGGRGNQCTNWGATIGGGGYDGITGNGNIAGGAASTVSGGWGNKSLASYATVGGGSQNLILAYATNAVISGGTANTIGTNNNSATIGGGIGNLIYGSSSFATGSGSTIGGGINNYIQTDAYDSTISGGVVNLIQSNAVYATIPGGFKNTAGGAYSFAAGNFAQALHQGAFVWADSQGSSFASTTNDQFLIRAQGGVGINTNNPNGAALSVNGSITSTMWKASGVIKSIGALPQAATFTSGGGTLLIFASGSGYSAAGNASIGMDVKLDGVAIDTCLIYANPAATHLAFVPTTIIKTGVAAGSHTLTFAARSGTLTDGSDSFRGTVQELPF